MSDFISRQAVLDIINHELNGWLTDDEQLHLEGIGIVIESLPTADVVERKVGEWTSSRPDAPMFGFHYCSLCGRKRTSPQDHYCPNCGAEMKGEGDGF